MLHLNVLDEPEPDSEFLLCGELLPSEEWSVEEAVQTEDQRKLNIPFELCATNYEDDSSYGINSGFASKSTSTTMDDEHCGINSGFASKSMSTTMDDEHCDHSRDQTASSCCGLKGTESGREIAVHVDLDSSCNSRIADAPETIEFGNIVRSPPAVRPSPDSAIAVPVLQSLSPGRSPHPRKSSTPSRFPFY